MRQAWSCWPPTTSSCASWMPASARPPGAWGPSSTGKGQSGGHWDRLGTMPDPPFPLGTTLLRGSQPSSGHWPLRRAACCSTWVPSTPRSGQARTAAAPGAPGWLVRPSRMLWVRQGQEWVARWSCVLPTPAGAGQPCEHPLPPPAGTFSVLRANFSQAPSPDMSAACLCTLEGLMAAQAQECAFEGLLLASPAAHHDHLAQEAAQVRPGSHWEKSQSWELAAPLSPVCSPAGGCRIQARARSLGPGARPQLPPCLLDSTCAGQG